MQAYGAANARGFLPRLFARAGGTDPAFAAWAGTAIASTAAGAMAALWASMAERDYRWLLPKLDLPVLVLHGEDSQLYDPAVSRWLAQRSEEHTSELQSLQRIMYTDFCLEQE